MVVKAKAVRAALTHPKTIEEKLSDRQIAEHVGVAQETVRRYRKDLESTDTISQLSERKGKDGKVRAKLAADAKERHAKLSGRPSKEKPPPNCAEVSKGDTRDKLAAQFGVSQADPPEKLPEGSKGDARDQAGKAAGVSGSHIFSKRKPENQK